MRARAPRRSKLGPGGRDGKQRGSAPRSVMPRNTSRVVGSAQCTSSTAWHGATGSAGKCRPLALSESQAGPHEHMKNSGPGPRHSSRGSLQRGPEPEGGCNRRKPRPSTHSSHGSAAAGVTKITAFRFAGTRPGRSAVSVAVPQRSTEKNHRSVCRVECLGLLCSTSHLALRGMNHAQDFTGCSADFADRPWSDYFAR